LSIFIARVWEGGVLGMEGERCTGFRSEWKCLTTQEGKSMSTLNGLKGTEEKNSYDRFRKGRLS